MEYDTCKTSGHWKKRMNFIILMACTVYTGYKAKLGKKHVARQNFVCRYAGILRVNNKEGMLISIIMRSR